MSTPLVLNSRNIAFGSRKQVAEMLGVHPKTVSDLVARGVIPQPFNLTPGSKSHGKGCRHLRWDMHEVAELVLKSRRGESHLALRNSK